MLDLESEGIKHDQRSNWIISKNHMKNRQLYKIEKVLEFGAKIFTIPCSVNLLGKQIDVIAQWLKLLGDQQLGLRGRYYE